MPPPADPASLQTADPTRAIAATLQLREAILAGDIAPGEKLNEQRLSTRLGISRTPLRAALQALALEGLLEYAPNRGYAVRVVPLAETLDAFEMRAALEGVAARLAAERGLAAPHRDQIARALAEGDAIVARARTGTPDLVAFRAVNIAFHDAVAAASASPRLADLVRLCSLAPAASTRFIPRLNADQLRRSHDDHHRMAEAIEAGQAWHAETLMRAHVLGLKAILLRATGAAPGR
jgi:GntR family transcriptional regulator of vanillate catabolism